MPMSTSSSPVLEDVEEFARLAGLNLDAHQSAVLREALRIDPKTGKWHWPTWTVPNLSSGQAADLVAARVLLGFLLLDENVLWTAPTRPVLRDAFQRLVHSVSLLGTQAEAPSLFDLGAGVTVKIRRANGEERLERLDTRKRIQFICTHLPGSGRGYTCDLLVVGQGSKYTDRVRCDLMPTMAARPNPQIVVDG